MTKRAFRSRAAPVRTSYPTLNRAIASGALAAAAALILGAAPASAPAREDSPDGGRRATKAPTRRLLGSPPMPDRPKPDGGVDAGNGGPE